jgi:Uncharacterized conserved protein
MYRKDSMDVISGALGKEKVHYHAPSPDDVPAEMSRFLEWFNSDSAPKDYVKSAIAHFWFVSIHPFDDGNGRISRAIADMALSQADDSPMRFFSMSRQINADKRKYYDILEKCQKGNLDITLWIEWYLDCMLRSIASAEEMLSKVLNKAIFWQKHSQANISERQQMVLNVYLDGYTGKLTAKNWAKHSDVSHDTAVRDIKDLVDKEILIPQPGRVRDISYGIRINDTVVHIPGPEES